MQLSPYLVPYFSVLLLVEVTVSLESIFHSIVCLRHALKTELPERDACDEQFALRYKYGGMRFYAPAFNYKIKVHSIVN